jgi:DNA replication protein DnaC
LETLLRSLKLPGMADMLGERLAQAASAQLGHAELLALLCGDELARRDAAGLARRLAAARFESTAAIEDLDFGYNPDVPAGTIRDLATLRFLDRGESIILHGPVGVGKTMLAQALGQLACRRGHTAAFTKPPGYSPTSPADTPTPRRRTRRPHLGHPTAPLGRRGGRC